MSSKLVVGWKTSETLEPIFWTTNPNPRLEDVTDDDLVFIDSACMEHHAAIIAQSGSGKSFFLGRLIEEIILKTRARCIIFDPNSDFKLLSETIDEDIWASPNYDAIKRRGRLSNEKTKSEFFGVWKEVGIKVHTASKTMPYHRELRLPWIKVPISFIVQDVDPLIQPGVHNIHKFVKTVYDYIFMKEIFIGEKRIESVGKLDILSQSEIILELIRSNPTSALETFKRELIDGINEKFAKKVKEADLKKLIAILGLQTTTIFGMFLPSLPMLFPPIKKSLFKVIQAKLTRRAEEIIELIISLPKYIDSPAEGMYFSKAKAMVLGGFFCSNLSTMLKGNEGFGSNRINVLDLPSLESLEMRLFACQSMIDQAWYDGRKQWAMALGKPKKEDERVPTFLIVDEAHNLIPASPQTKAEQIVRDSFRRIVAEGRKLGLFLILCTQRPEKVDPLVLSDCENLAIMKINTPYVLNSIKQEMGIDQIPRRKLEKCLDFPVSRVLFAGPWSATEGLISYTAARRTKEGGRNINTDFWTQEPEKTLPKIANATDVK